MHDAIAVQEHDRLGDLQNLNHSLKTKSVIEQERTYPAVNERQLVAVLEILPSEDVQDARLLHAREDKVQPIRVLARFLHRYASKGKQPLVSDRSPFERFLQKLLRRTSVASYTEGRRAPPWLSRWCRSRRS